MADKILVKRSNTPGSIPTTASLDSGELALNIPDKLLYTLSGSSVVALNDTTRLQTSEISIDSGNFDTIVSGSFKDGIFNSTEVLGPPISTTKYSGANVEYTAQRTGAVRSGLVIMSWSGSQASYVDVSNADMGDTSDISFNVIVSEDTAYLRAYSLGTGVGEWSVQVLYKLFPNLL